MASLPCARVIVLALLFAGCSDDSTVPGDDEVGEDPACSMDSPCPAGWSCAAGTCYPNGSDSADPGCYDDDDCPFGAGCDGEVCMGAQTIATCPAPGIQVRATLALNGTGSAFAIGDVDGDGVDDLVIVDDEGLRTYAIATDTTIATPLTIAAGITRELTLMQSDADGLADVAISTGAADHVQIFHGDGLGGFTNETLRTTESPPVHPTRLRNATGTDALMVRLSATAQLQIFADEDDAAPIQTFEGSFDDVDVADLDNDGIDELLLLDAGQLEIWTANANAASLALASSHDASAQPYTASCDSIVAGDLGDDGVADLVCVAKGVDQSVAIGIWWRQPSGYQVEDAFALTDGGSGVAIAALYTSETHELLLGDGSFVRPNLPCHGQTGYADWSPIVAGDLDGDGRDEVIRRSDPTTLVVLAIYP